MKKYNLSNIMKKAWEIRKTSLKWLTQYHKSFADCLKMAWAQAKAEVAKAETAKEITIDTVEKIAEKYAEELSCAGIQKVSLKEWKKGDISRTYVNINCYTNARNLKKRINCGYINNVTGEYVKGDVDLAA